MSKELVEAIKAYKAQHPEVEEIMRQFQVSQDAYEKALAAISFRIERSGPTYQLTTEGRYNANVSGLAR